MEKSTRPFFDFGIRTLARTKIIRTTTVPDIQCQQCKTILEITPDLIGQQLICPSCSWQFIIPAKRTAQPVLGNANLYNPMTNGRSDVAVPHSNLGSRPSSDLSTSRKLRCEPIPRSSRWYVHQKCGAETGVEGDDYERMANPLNFISRTYCTQCQSVFGVEEFVWKDTREKISDYNARVLGQVSDPTLFLCRFMHFGTLLSPLLGVALGCLIGLFMGWIVGTISAIVLAVTIFGLAAYAEAQIMEHQIIPKSFGVEDCRQLT